MVGLAALLLLAGCGSKESYYEKACTAMEEGDYELAFEEYGKAIMEDEKLRDSYRGAGIACFMMADYDQAEEYFDRALKESKGKVGEREVDVSYYLGETYASQGRVEEAIDTYSNIIAFDKKQKDARLYRGILYVRQGDLEKGKKDFEKLLEEKEVTVGLCYQIYQALSTAGDEDAVTYLNKGLEVAGKSKEDLYVKGLLHMAASDSEAALSALEESRKAGYGKAAFSIGEIQESLGNLEAANASYDEYVKLSNVTPQEYVQIADCKIRSGDPEGAKSICEKAVANADKASLQYVRFQEVTILERMGEFQEAKTKLEAYLRDYPNDEKAKRESDFLSTR